MDKVSVVLRVFFEDPFWIGVLERVESGRMTVCKITFGPEPGQKGASGVRHGDQIPAGPEIAAGADKDRQEGGKQREKGSGGQTPV